MRSGRIPSEDTHRIAVVAYDGISPFHLAVPGTVFGENLDGIGTRPYDVVVCTELPGSVRMLSGLSIDVQASLIVLDTADTVIVPAWSGPDAHASSVLLDSLRRAHARGARIVGLCLGAFVLAEAGLLDGRTASTHWAWADDFGRRFPRVSFDRGVLYVDDGDVVTSAGTAAAIDCCPHLLRTDQGAEAANRVARRLVVAPHRGGGQAQYIERPLPRIVDGDRLGPAIARAMENLALPIGLDEMARLSNMSRRHFSRRFRESTGTTFTRWLLARRLERGQRLLETSDHRMDRVADEAGFASTASFRQHFSKAFSLSPSAYRSQFRGPERLISAIRDPSPSSNAHDAPTGPRP